MNDHKNHECWDIGGRNGVLCAALGAVVALTPWILSMAFIGNLGIVSKAPFVIGVLALFLGAGFLGTRAGMYLCKQGNQTGTNVLIGIALAFGSIIISVLAAAITHIVSNPSDYLTDPSALVEILFMPLLAILFWGAIPATGLGVLYGFLVRRQLAKVKDLPLEGRSLN